MESIILSQELRPDPSAVVTVGTFDGMHLGHRDVLDYLTSRARISNGTSTIVTFDPHPLNILQNMQVPLLSTIKEREAICQRWNIDRFVVIPFTRSFSEIDAAHFVKDVLLDRIGMQEIVVGHDHSFGRGGVGNELLLRSLAPELNFTVDSIPAKFVENAAVSSSRIRHLIREKGSVGEANQLLGYEYGINTRVVHGSARGHEIGFPTANLVPLHPDKILPADGVYAVRVFVDSDETPRSGMMNIGVRPTFGESDKTIEVHILNYNADLYERQLRIEFVERLREERQFDGIESLVRQLNSDRERCIAFLSGAPKVSPGRN